ncbi:LysR substrate-binding domain-containing protein [Mesorhizobium sp. M1A.T.Ca.IN.004.03.1.1]|uniref:LysR substrate-binding domain-containing protein n=1 Tax=Mesorhizobium sp. M1A.T.Ca.IN.004.03.1.1 TaxID=2496795 RepID=UPI0013E2D3C9|nr:LysR substrate-binding domain-containing protein [Mesorhizobium sp. M1A.T.Ca.IN.004.03.1.1]
MLESHSSFFHSSPPNVTFVHKWIAMRRKLPSLNALRVFEVAAQFQSFTRAAEELNVTHGSVSKHVKNLEHSLGTGLFERSTRRMTLTNEGHALLQSTKEGFDVIEQALLAINQKKNGSQRLLILCDADFASLRLMPRIKELREGLGGARVEIEAVEGASRNHLDSGDCAIWYGPRSSRSAHSEKLFSSTLFPVASPALQTATAPLKTPADLRLHTLLHDRSTEEWRRYFQVAGLKDLGYDDGEILGTSSLTLQATLRGMGVAIGDNFLCARHLREGTLVRPFGPSFPSSNSYFISYNPLSSRQRLIGLFRQWIRNSKQIL